MRHEYLIELDTDALDAYARRVGADVGKASTKAEKVRVIERKLSHVAHVPVLGMEVDIPIKRMRDMRITTLVQRAAAPGMTNDQYDQLLGLLVGKDQHDAIVTRCTDEDGTIDQEAYGLAIDQILGSDELKNS
ncbi:MAG: hypothetical protein ACI360_08585 [Atopobiaceae bacterium]